MKIKKHFARVLAGVTTALVAALILSPAAGAAPPYATSAKLTDVHFVDQKVESGKEAKLSGAWSLPDNAATPAGFVVDLPAGLQGNTDSFPLLDPSGVAMGQCVVTAKQIICDLDSAYLAEHPRNVSGTFNFWVTVETKVTEDTETHYKFDEIDTSVIVTPPVTCTENCEWQGGPSVKYGVYNRDDNTIAWTVRIGADKDGATAGQKMRVDDKFGPNQELLTTYQGQSFPMLRQATGFVIDQNGDQVPGPWIPVPASEYTVNGGIVSWTATEGAFYSVMYMAKVTDGGAAGKYTNGATVTIDGVENGVTSEVVRHGGGGTGEGDQVGRFSITKAVRWADSPIPGLSFEGDYTVTAPNGSKAEGKFSVAENGIWTSPEFATGSTVHLNEVTPTAPGNIDWKTPEFSVNDFAIEGAKTVAVTLTNTAELAQGKFSAHKELAGDRSDRVKDRTFLLDYSYPAGPGFSAGSGTLELPGTGSIVTSGPLPVGAVVTVRERAPEGVTGATWAPAKLSTETVTIGRDELVDVTVTNTLTANLGVFTASKRVRGTAAEQVSPLAQFSLSYSYPAGPGFEGGSGTLRLPADGTVVTSPKLPIGAEVTLREETPAPIENAAWKAPELSTQKLTIGQDATVNVIVTNTLDRVPPTVPPTTPPAKKPALATTGGSDPSAALGIAGALLLAGLGALAARRAAVRRSGSGIS